MNINAPVGERDGWPSLLLLSWYGGAPSDAQTQAQLAQACLALGMRRRLTIPICGFIGFGGSSGIASIILPFSVRVEGFARTGRFTGFYHCDSSGGCRVKLEVQITTPSHTSKIIQMPPSIDSTGTEFSVDVDVGDGDEDTAGIIKGFVFFEIVDEVNAGTSLVLLYGTALEVLPALQGEVATT